MLHLHLIRDTSVASHELGADSMLCKLSPWLGHGAHTTAYWP